MGPALVRFSAEMFVPSCVCPMTGKSCRRILVEFFGRMRCSTGNSWLDSGDDRHRDVDMGIIFAEILPMLNRENSENLHRPMLPR